MNLFVQEKEENGLTEADRIQALLRSTFPFPFCFVLTLQTESAGYIITDDISGIAIGLN
jgi:hypothetical protein